MQPRPSPRLPRPELLLAILGALLLAAGMHAPLLPHMATHVPADLSDPLLQAWEVAWNGHALVHQPTRLFDTNAFWPLPTTLALSDALIGYAPAGLVGEGVTAALIRYDVLFLATYVLAFLGAYLLARELGVGPVAAAVAGVAFAYAPWRLSQINHLHVLSSGGIPMAFFLLLRGVRGGRQWMVFWGFVVAAWQVSLGFVLGLPLLYALLIASIVVGLGWLGRGRPPPDRRLLLVGGAGAGLLVMSAALLSLPYLQAGTRYPESRRTESEVAFFSAPPAAFLVAPEESVLWGDLTAPLRERVAWPNEQSLFPGALIAGLALVGMIAGRTYPLSIRLALGLTVMVAAVLSLGLRVGSGILGYRYLYEWAPGWDRIRVPSRLMTFATLALALLAAAGSSRLMTIIGRGDRIRPAWVRGGVTIVLLGGLVLEGSGRLPIRRVPAPPDVVAELPAPHLHLPMTHPTVYMLWSTDGFPPTVNGFSGINPRQTIEVIRETVAFPDGTSVAYLRELGVRTVFLHRNLAAGTLWESSAIKPVDGLPLCRSERGDVIVFVLEPSSASGGPAPAGC